MKHSQPYCTITASGNRLRVRFGGLDPDDFAVALEDLKDRVPPDARDFDLAAKTWVIDCAWSRAVKAWATDWFDRITWSDDAAGEIEGRDSHAAALAALCLRPGAPPELVRAAFRVLARLHHPDVGGDTATMTALNRAYAALTQTEARSA